MPEGTEPAWIWKSLLYREFGRKVKEIEMANDFYVHTDTPATAQAIVARFDGTGCGEKSHLYKKAISVKAIPMTEAPEEDRVRLRLTDFLKTEAHMPRTKTVLVRGLPHGHPKAAVKAMCDQIIDDWNINDDPALGPLTKDLQPRVLHIEMGIMTNDALVRFTSWEVADEMVAVLNGGFWNNATTYAECVPNSELDEVMPDKTTQGATAKLFIGGVKPGASFNDIRDLFHPHVPKDIHMAPGGRRFAFVFLPKNAAEKFMNDFPNGKRHGGWTYHVTYADKKGKANPRKMTQSYQSSVPATWGALAASARNNPIGKASSTEKENTAVKFETQIPVMSTVRLSGLVFSTSQDLVRDFCEMHNVYPQEIHVVNGQATIKFRGSRDADHAALILNQKKIQQKKVVAVKVD
ncbi:hypothetical protein SLS60_003910 [Paraconiothyrium brasiliense]|uniref:RRM domain-containing protein n=1 Tax=Paraconiothyrium brasiliense TaxID=300254 RepID=A0ABR3RPZ1_9PLEO